MKHFLFKNYFKIIRKICCKIIIAQKGVKYIKYEYIYCKIFKNYLNNYLFSFTVRKTKTLNESFKTPLLKPLVDCEISTYMLNCPLNTG